MITTDLQKYIIKRQFIKNIYLLETDPEPAYAFTKTPIFKSTNNVEFELNLQPFEALGRVYPEFLSKFKEKFRFNATLLAQYVMQDVSAEQIMSGIIPKFKPIKLTLEFLQWNLPAIHEIVDAYLNDTAICWKENQNFNVMLMFENPF